MCTESKKWSERAGTGRGRKGRTRIRVDVRRASGLFLLISGPYLRVDGSATWRRVRRVFLMVEQGARTMFNVGKPTKRAQFRRNKQNRTSFAQKRTISAQKRTTFAQMRTSFAQTRTFFAHSSYYFRTTMNVRHDRPRIVIDLPYSGEQKCACFSFFILSINQLLQVLSISTITGFCLDVEIGFCACDLPDMGRFGLQIDGKSRRWGSP